MQLQKRLSSLRPHSALPSRCKESMHRAALVSLFLLPAVLGATLLPFGPGAGDTGIDPNGVAGEHTLSSGEFAFYGKRYKELYVHIDGVIGIGRAPVYYGPYSFPLSPFSMVAPFWAGADTSLYNEPAVFYRETIDPTLILEVKNYIDGLYGVSFTPAGLFIATWDSIGYQNKHVDKLNTFQAVLAFNQFESYVLFLYDTIQWTTADRSGGENGLGGDPAIVGLNSGDGMRYLTIRNSGSSEIIDVEHDTNVGVDGLFIFRTDTDTVAPAPFALYPFGGQLDSNLASGDNVVSTTTLGVPVVFFGLSHTAVLVATDGYILLGSGSSLSSTPQNFPIANNVPMIAPFWADADTQGAGVVYYRETSDSSLLEKAEREIGLSYGDSFKPTSLFIVTWDGVGYSSGHTDKKNTFQAVIASDGSQSYILFLYGDLQWTTGDSNGGSGGTGGAAAVAGINAGDGENFFLLPGSGTASVLNLDSDSNIAVNGQFVLSAGNAKLYTYGYGLDTRYITNSNDGSLYLSSSNFPESFQFGGTSYNNVKVYVNGYFTVGGSGGSYCPLTFPTTGTGIVAPFWSDADTRNGAGMVFARVTSDICVLSRARTDIRASTGNSAFSPDWLLIVTWNDVGYEPMHADKTNTFQAVLASDGVNTHVLYLYEKLQWLTGDHCATPAAAGISLGNGVNSVSLPGSETNAVMSYTSTSNVGMPGLFILPYVSVNPETPARMMSYFANARLRAAQYRDPLFAQTSSVPAQPHNEAYKGLNDHVTVAALPPGIPLDKINKEKQLALGHGTLAGPPSGFVADHQYKAHLQNLGYATYQSLNNRRRPTRPVQAQHYMDYPVAQDLSTSPVIGPKPVSQMNTGFMGPMSFANKK